MRKDIGKYREYTVIVNGQLYASVKLKDASGKFVVKRKKVNTKTEARQWALEQLSSYKESGANLKIESKTTFAEVAYWYKKFHLVKPVIENGGKVDGVKDWKASRNKLDRITEYFGGIEVDMIDPPEGHIKEYLGGTLLVDVTAVRLKEFVRHRRNIEGVATTTINRDLALIRAMFHAAQDVYDLLKVPKVPFDNNAEKMANRDRVLSLEEEKLLLGQCYDGKELITVTRKGKTFTQETEVKRARLKPLITFAIDTAMRAGEIYKLEWKNVDMQKREISVLASNTKTQSFRTVPMSVRVVALLEAMPLKSGKVFRGGNYKKSFRSACDRVGFSEGETALNFHDLRHTGTTRLVRSGVPHSEAMKITGHTQLKTFMRYMKLTSEAVQSAGQKLDAYYEAQEAILASDAVN